MPMHILNRLLHCSSEEFLKEIWGHGWHYRSGSATEYLGLLPSIRSLDELYFSLESAGTRLGIVDGHASPSTGTSLIRADGRVALDELHAAYRSGKTLLVTHLQNSHLGIARLARLIERDLHKIDITLQKEIGANLFLTPSDSKGFEPHYDGHDVLIIQLSGSKTWEIFDRTSDPILGTEGRRVASCDLSQKRKTVLLNQGDVLYLPRGIHHAAYTASSPSLHLTLSIVPISWANILCEAVACSKNSGDRYSPTQAMLVSEIDKDNIARQQKNLRVRWLSKLHCLPDQSPWTAPSYRDTEEIILSEGVIAELECLTSSDPIKLTIPGSSLKLDYEALDSIKLILSGEPVSINDLPLGTRTSDSKLRFVKALVEAGLITLMPK